MTESVLAGAKERKSAAGGALGAAAGVWFLAFVIGQWVFLSYIVTLYGDATLSGNFEAWNANKMLRKGYVAGDTAGNLAFATHVVLAAIVAFGGLLQLIPQIRARAIAFHRWNGRVFLLAAIGVGVSGLYMVWVRAAGGDMTESIASSLNAVLIFIFAGTAWRAARTRDIVFHRRWALRTFIVANGNFFIRAGVPVWFIFSGGKISPLTLHIFNFACYLVPLAVLELYLRAKDSGGPRVQLAASGVLLAGTAYMSFGIFAFYMFVTQQILGGSS